MSDETDAIEFGAVTKFTEMEQGRLIIHSREVGTVEAILAERLIEQGGMIMGEPAGEVSAGRRTDQLMSPAEVGDAPGSSLCRASRRSTTWRASARSAKRSAARRAGTAAPTKPPIGCCAIRSIPCRT